MGQGSFATEASWKDSASQRCPRPMSIAKRWAAILPEDRPPLRLSIRAPFDCDTQRRAFQLVHILLIFTGGELDRTHGPFQRLS